MPNKDILDYYSAVLPENVDIATQEIVQMAEEVDPRGQRKFGVLTTIDLIVDKGAENKVSWSLIHSNKLYDPLSKSWNL